MANQRNGASAKTVPLRFEVHRDRDGSFEPLLTPKHERRFTGFDDKSVATDARGMTVREIQAFLAEQCGTEVSPEFNSSVTEADAKVASFIAEGQKEAASHALPSDGRNVAIGPKCDRPRLAPAY